MTDLETLIADTRTADATLLETVEAWTPSEDFNALLMQSYSNQDANSIDALRIQVFTSFYTDELIETNQKLNLAASNLTVADYRTFLTLGISASNAHAVQTAFQAKLMESLTSLMQN